MLSNKTIVLGVTGGIAVYKAADIVSRLKKLSINVHVIMTNAAQEFVAPMTFQSLSQNYVVTDMFKEPKTWDVEHIALAQKADLFLIAPATANIIGKLANGIADDMLSTTVMATKSPVLIAPAMNTNMYENPIVQANIEKLRNYGYQFIEPTVGRLACGDYGSGKLAEPETIVEAAVHLLHTDKDLKGLKMIVTAGPTRESIDPVRYITNHSSGKMGYSIAEKAALRGAEVVLISGPTNLKTPMHVKRVDVVSAQDMYKAVTDYYPWCDVLVKSAAVADYRPSVVADNKIKKGDGDFAIQLTRNHDILYELGKIKADEKIHVGFAAETQNVIENAKKKIHKKKLDFIVANDLTSDGAGFMADTNIVSIIDKENHIEHYEKMSKKDLADVILSKIKAMYHME